MKLKEKVKIKSWEPQSSAMGSESHRAQREGAEISAGPTLDPTPRALGSAQPQDPQPGNATSPSAGKAENPQEQPKPRGKTPQTPGSSLLASPGLHTQLHPLTPPGCTVIPGILCTKGLKQPWAQPVCFTDVHLFRSLSIGPLFYLDICIHLFISIYLFTLVI